MIRLILCLTIIVLFLILGLPFLGIIWIISKFNKKTAEHLARNSLRCLAKGVVFFAGLKLQVIGEENLLNTPVLYVANHQSYFDAIITLAQDNMDFGFIAKKEISKIPFLAPWMKLMGCIFLDREDIRAGMQVILSAIENIKTNTSVFIFPEGTRSKDCAINEFKGGSFKVATKSNCPIIPVTIKGTYNAYEAHAPRITPEKVLLVIGEPIYTDKLSPESKKNISVWVQEIISNTYESLVL